MMEGAKVSKENEWKKCLTYTKAIFSRIYNICTISSDRTTGAMLYVMLLATDLLEAFTAPG